MEKGTYGYLGQRKKKQLRMALLWGVLVVILALIGLMIWGTKLNLLMVPAMLCVIPFANYLVSYVALASYRSGAPEQYAALRAFEEAGMLLADLVLVDEKGERASMDFAVVYQGGIAGYQSEKKDTRDRITITVNDLMKRRGIPMRIKVYRDWEEFLQRITEMNAPADDASLKKVKRARDALISVCL
ncbi:MAG: hypothetical protein LUF00_07370 [Lachnospiraceae bacterium]|nr:hypothetical protein [Lachnospiraceae bacterium]